MFGGLGAHVLALTQQQAQQGHKVTVITQRGCDEDPPDEWLEGVRVLRVFPRDRSIPFDQVNLDRWVHSFAMASAQIAQRHFDDNHPQVIHAHDWVAAEQASIVARTWRVPKIVTIHATESGRHNGWLTTTLSRVVHAREQEMATSASAVIVCSRAMKKEVIHLFSVRDSVVHVIPNGIGRKPIVRENISETPGRFRVGFVGRIEWEKGLHHLIDAIEVVGDQTYELVVIGSGSQEELQRERVLRKGLSDQVRFLGKLNETDRDEELLSCDVVVVPSSYEPFGMVALEAASLHIPLVVSRVGGLTDIVPDEKHGYVLPVTNGKAIATCLRMIRSYPDSAQLRVKALSDRVEREFTWDQIARRTISLYRETLA